MALSIDLRERVIAAIDNKMRITKAAEVFKVSRRIIYHWLNLRKTSGCLEGKTGYHRGHSHKITDWAAFKSFAYEHRQCNSLQMITAWQALTGVKVSQSVIWRALKKIDFTSKKKLLGILKQTKQSEQNS